MSATKYIFSGHESFPCKSLWLKKGYDFVVAGNQFSSPQAVMELGVGKNMVASIRYWLKAFNIIEPTGEISWLGKYLFDEESGKDKYIEDLGTIWILHFNIINHLEATIYNWLFRGFQRERKSFSRDHVISYIKRRFAEDGKQNVFNANTIKKDVGVLLQNYSLPSKPKSNEDYSILLIDLDLIRQSMETKEYYFNIEGKRSVDSDIFLYSLLTVKGEDNTIPFEFIQEKVGLSFCMNEMETIHMLQELSKKYANYMQYSDVAGIRQLQFIKALSIQQVLDNYYGTEI